MNPYQIEKCTRIVRRKGFEAQQDKLIDECEKLIEAAEGDEYEPFITDLANVRIMVEQMRLSLSKEQQEEYFTKLNNEISRQYRESAGFFE